jgi:hypothetical protein
MPFGLHEAPDAHEGRRFAAILTFCGPTALAWSAPVCSDRPFPCHWRARRLVQRGQDGQDGNRQRGAIRPQPDGDNHQAVGVRIAPCVFHAYPSEVLPVLATSRAAAEGEQCHELAWFSLTGVSGRSTTK